MRFGDINICQAISNQVTSTYTMWKLFIFKINEHSELESKHAEHYRGRS